MANPKRIVTEYGTVHHDLSTTRITGNPSQTWAWANRPGSIWPCSALSGDRVSVTLDSHGDTVEMTAPDDLTNNELSAWQSDVLSEAITQDSTHESLLAKGIRC